MGTVLTDNTELARYELTIDGQLAAFEDYALTPGTISLIHTAVLPEFAGRGLAKELVVGVLEDVRLRGLAVLPLCTYVASVIGRNPEAYLDLVPAENRSTVGLPG